MLGVLSVALTELRGLIVVVASSKEIGLDAEPLVLSVALTELIVLVVVVASSKETGLDAEPSGTEMVPDVVDLKGTSSWSGRGVSEPLNLLNVLFPKPTLSMSSLTPSIRKDFE